MALPSLTQQRMQQNDDIALMPYVKYTLGESISTALKSSFLSLQSKPAKIPLLRMLGGGILAERADIKKREMYESQGRDPNTGRKLTRAEVEEINNRRKSYGVMGEIRDSVIGIFDLLNEGGDGKSSSMATGLGLLKSEERGGELLAQAEANRRSDRKFWSELFENYFSIRGKGFISLRSAITTDGGGGGGLLGSLLSSAIVGAILAAMAPVVAATFRAMGIKKLPKWVETRIKASEPVVSQNKEVRGAKPSTPEPETARVSKTETIEPQNVRQSSQLELDTAKGRVAAAENDLARTSNALREAQARGDNFNLKSLEDSKLRAANELKQAKANLADVEARLPKAPRTEIPEAPRTPKQPKIVTPSENIPVTALEEIGLGSKMARGLGKAVPYLGAGILTGFGAYESYQVEQSDMTRLQKNLDHGRIWTSTTMGVIGELLGSTLGLGIAGLLGLPSGPGAIVTAAIGSVLGSYIGAELGLASGAALFDFGLSTLAPLFGIDHKDLAPQQQERQNKVTLKQSQNMSTPGIGFGSYIVDEIKGSFEGQGNFFKALWNWTTGNGFTPNVEAPVAPGLGANFNANAPASQQMAALDNVRRSNMAGGNVVVVNSPTTVNSTTTSSAAIATPVSAQRTGADSIPFFARQQIFALG